MFRAQQRNNNRVQHAGTLARPSMAAGAQEYAGAGVTIRPEHQAALDETLSDRVKCVPNYRNRIMEHIKWLKVNHEEHAAQVVVGQQTRRCITPPLTTYDMIS